VAGLASAPALAQDVQANPGSAAARDGIAIERLHQLDVETTLTDKADELSKLWDNDGVRLTEGRSAEVGKAVIDADNKLSRTKNPEWRTIYYKPEIKDVQIVGDWAFEWGYFETAHQESASATEVALRGKTLRVFRRQTDGSWKIAHKSR
jgi:uncharacterized protein DUF4440